MSAFSDLFTKELDNDLIWREAELAILKKALLSAVPGTPQEQTLLRANLALIYAHYEGFSKFALGVYIDALRKLTLKRKDLIWPLAAYSMRKFFSDLRTQTDHIAFFEKFVNDFNNCINDHADYESPMETSNLWPNQLINWLTKLNLKHSSVTTNYAVLYSLVDSRNKIAHGKKLTVSGRTDLDQYFNAAALVMHEIAVEVSDALEKHRYRRGGTVYTILEHSPP